MRRVFADTYYWIPLLNDRDQGQAAARAATQALQGIPLVTTEEVLTEVLAFFCEEGRYLRQMSSATVRGLFTNPLVHVEPQSHQSFEKAGLIHKARISVLVSESAAECALNSRQNMRPLNMQGRAYYLAWPFAPAMEDEFQARAAELLQ